MVYWRKQTEKGNTSHCNSEKYYSLLPCTHKQSCLNAKHIHEEGSQRVSLTTSKVRSRFWIIGLPRMVKSIRYNCVTCKKLDNQTATQLMGQLPQEGLKVAPAWNCTAVDLFGLEVLDLFGFIRFIWIRGEPQAKRMASSSTALAREQYT